MDDANVNMISFRRVCEQKPNKSGLALNRIDMDASSRMHQQDLSLLRN